MAIYLVDYENVKNLLGINNLTSDDKVIIFYSKKANTLTFDLHQAILSSQAKIEYKCVEVGGQNALDFQLSSYLGYLIKENENSQRKIYIIISKDRGFSFVKSFWSKEKSIDIQILTNLVGDVQDVDNVQDKDLVDEKLDIETDIKKLLKEKNIKLSDAELKEIIAMVKKYKTTQTINGYLNKLLKDSAKTGIILKIIKPYIKNSSI